MGVTDQAAEPDPLLALPGVMHALWPSTCPCGSPIAVGDVQGPADVPADTPTGRAWVCRACLTPTVPEPRDGETTVEVAR